MKGQKKIKKKIEKAVDLKVEIKKSGFNIYPGDDSLILTLQLDILLIIARKYHLRHYINFEDGYLRLH